MGATWVHRLTNIDEINKTADCLKCGKVSVVIRRKSNRVSGWRCLNAKLELDARGGWDIIAQKSAHRAFLKDTCNICGFLPEDKCQLDIDHIDGNHNNNEESNLQTLCANCHRLKTKRNRDYLSYADKIKPS